MLNAVCCDGLQNRVLMEEAFVVAAHFLLTLTLPFLHSVCVCGRWKAHWFRRPGLHVSSLLWFSDVTCSVSFFKVELAHVTHLNWRVYCCAISWQQLDLFSTHYPPSPPTTPQFTCTSIFKIIHSSIHLSTNPFLSLIHSLPYSPSPPSPNHSSNHVSINSSIHPLTPLYMFSLFYHFV